MTFKVSAAAAASGYHFDHWEISGGTATTSTTASPLTVTVQSASTGGSANATNCTVRAVYAENYYATLTGKKTSGGSADPTITGTNNVATSGGDVTFNISAANANPGYHFTGWSSSGTKSIKSFGKSTDKNTTAIVTASSTAGSANAATGYEVCANYAANYYVRVNSASSPSAGGTAYVKYGSSFSGTSTSELDGYGKGWSGAAETFSIQATPAATYRFTGWTLTGGDGNGTISSSSSTSTTISVKTTSGHTGTSNPAVYTVTANFVQNRYYAKLTANAGSNGTASVTASPQYTTTSGGDVIFNITATPSSGCHFVQWSTSGAGFFGDIHSTSTTFTVPAATAYDEANALSYTVTATFAVDQFAAQLNTAVSSGSDTSTSTAQVSADNSNWGASASKISNTSGTSQQFYVKATPATGFKFMGWTATNGSSTTIPSLGATGTYNVSASTTEGGTNTQTIYAIFKAEYSITINANGSATGDNVVFNVVNNSDPSKTYRISVPVGASRTLTDVYPGDYTITPESSWSWSYNVSPASSTTSYSSVNVSTHNFTCSPRSSVKTHAESKNTL